jgi:GntR family transcriptional regulator
MKIDKSLDIPLYRQVEKFLEDKIKYGEWSIGYQLSPERELAELFNVSNITVKRAIIELVNKGYLYRERGRGTFVSIPPKEKEQDINTIFSITSDIEEHPHKMISFSVEEAGLEIAKKLQVDKDTLVIKMKRLKMEGEEPLAVEYSYVPYSICPNFSSNDVENELIYNVLKKKYNIPLRRTKMYIKPNILDREEAELLQIKSGTPVFEWERLTFSKQEEIIEYSKFFIRHDKETYYTEVYF